jgi:quercetin dioxygenase-like cupin family protein
MLASRVFGSQGGNVKTIAGGVLLLWSLTTSAQDALQYGLKHLTLLAEDDKVRVLKYAPKKGDRTPVHSHPQTILYVVKGGKVRITLPDGKVQEADLKAGSALLRPPVVHEDEALDDLEVVLIELKK